MHVKASAVIDSASIKTTLPEFSGLPVEFQASACKSLTASDYVASDWIPIQTARKEFSVELGGPQGFDQWVLGSMRINPTEAYVQYNTSKKVCT